MPIFLILLRKIKKMGIHSKYFLAASAAKGLLRQPLGQSAACLGALPTALSERQKASARGTKQLHFY
jgi:hypothetical protein